VKRYLVVGSSTIAIEGSHAPGDTFEADMSATLEEFLTRIGAIEEVTPASVDANHGAAAPITHPGLDSGDDVKEEE
jgi:hypothetical protein